MKKIKIFLQYPWKFPDSLYYKNLVDNSPSNVKFINDDLYGVQEKENFLKSNAKKGVIKKSLNLFRLSFPNIHRVPKNLDCDLVHSAHSFPLTNKPWIADIEGQVSLIVGHYRNFLTEYFVKKIILSKKCKKILPWTKWARDEISERFNNKEINKKLEVVYPAIKYVERKKQKHDLTIIFAARYFWIKGGLIALEVFDRLIKKYKINSHFISDVPEDLKKKYKNIKFYDLVSQKELYDKFYSTSDILIYPAFVDTFGFALLEAMAFDLPIVTVNNPTRKEIVEDGENGYVVNSPKDIDYYNIGDKEEKVIEDLVKKASILIERPVLRKRMGANGRRMVEFGKFSIRERNKTLKKIYEEALSK